MSLKKSLDKLKNLITAVEINQMNEGPIPTSTNPVNFINETPNSPIDCKKCCYLGQVSIDGKIYAAVRCRTATGSQQFIYNGYTEQANIMCKPGTGNKDLDNQIFHCNDFRPGAPIVSPTSPKN